jgi:hypothetical protein
LQIYEIIHRTRRRASKFSKDRVKKVQKDGKAEVNSDIEQINNFQEKLENSDIEDISQNLNPKLNLKPKTEDFNNSAVEKEITKGKIIQIPLVNRNRIFGKALQDLAKNSDSKILTQSATKPEAITNFRVAQKIKFHQH